MVGIKDCIVRRGCKRDCPVFKKQKYIEGQHKNSNKRENQTELREIILERDDYTCQKCGKTNINLFCHHIDPVINNPIESFDIDNCITLCDNCHKEAHKIIGCNYYELRCK